MVLSKSFHRPIMLPPVVLRNTSYNKERPSGPATLQDMCIRKLNRSIDSYNVLELMKVMEDIAMPLLCNIYTSCIRYVMRSYATLRERRTSAELQRLLPEELYLRLEGALLERERTLSTPHTYAAAPAGRIVEPSEPQAQCFVNLPSVAGHPLSYTYEALTSGVRWPADINPAVREQHLCAEEFLRVVGMTFVRFRALPVWRQTELKKELKLF